MTRIKKLCSYLDKCRSFADVGCDHGYCTQYMLRGNLCERAVISDVSEKCLEKAEKLLSGYIAQGRVTPVCCDGLEKVRGCDSVLIAGMGGEQIISIFKNGYIPENFTLQPMKNVKELRSFLLDCGARITLDDMFSDGKNYYFIIKGKRQGGSAEYCAEELEFGRDSLKNPIFRQYALEEIKKKEEYLTHNMTDLSREKVTADIEFMRGALKKYETL